jgi:transposase
MGRPAKHSVDFKARVVLSVLRGEMTGAEAARRHGVSETSIGKWKEQFVAAGRAGLERAGPARVSGEQARLTAQVDELTHALGEAHVELRLLRREGAGLPPTQSWR